MTQALIAINVAVFIGETASGTPLGGVGGNGVGTLYEKGALYGPFVDHLHQYYRLATAGLPA